MDRSARFWDKMAERYSRRPIADEAAYEKKLQVTREYFRPDMQVLEFGCGTGSTAIAHAPYVERIHAIDISSKMIGIAQGKAAAAKVENVDFEQATIEAFVRTSPSGEMIEPVDRRHAHDPQDSDPRRSLRGAPPPELPGP